MSSTSVSTPRRRFRAVAVPLAVAAVLAGNGTGAPTAHAAVLASTSTGNAAPAAHAATPNRCGGQGVDPAARIRYSSDTVIEAPLATVWKLQTDVRRWPTWQPPVLTAARLDPGPLKPGSRFRWTTPAPATPTTPATTLTITSTVRELRRHHCVLWSGPAIGEGLRIDEGVHLWTFTETGDGVRVHTEETWTGSQVEADVPTATAALGAGLETWLRDLKAAAEK
ncbi:SRPBCC family protein [Streptomyces niveiscabiei]|uniref:SRPBCC family protein n=1 Tax=Streptomyces niveiscabiei TaxID=164115 RepID=UPI0006EB5F88|nr:SRPBCC family protein [Streptomyces niveiscabiei]